MLLAGFSIDGPIHLHNLMIFITFLGNTVAAFAVSFLVSLAFEAPIVNLLKIIMKTSWHLQLFISIIPHPCLKHQLNIPNIKNYTECLHDDTNFQVWWRRANAEWFSTFYRQYRSVFQKLFRTTFPNNVFFPIYHNDEIIIEFLNVLVWMELSKFTRKCHAHAGLLCNASRVIRRSCWGMRRARFTRVQLNVWR